MNIKTEFLNFITGILLVAAGVFNLFGHDFVMGMNWIVFGSMYLVMGDYVQVASKRTLLEKATDIGRQIFSWVGLAGSILVFLYYIKIFFV